VDCTDLSYLKNGNPRQQSAYQTLVRLNIFSYLSKYRPLLTGTVPLGIDIESSDLDISCEVYEHRSFIQQVGSRYGDLSEFAVESTNTAYHSIIIRFYYQPWVIELFGQPLPTMQQHAYRHMMVEHQILQLASANFCRKVRELKQQGIKTEPAFAQLLNLSGNPYRAMLSLEKFSEQQLSHLLTNRGYLK